MDGDCPHGEGGRKVEIGRREMDLHYNIGPTVSLSMKMALTFQVF